jgi:hypothetical protein
MEGNAMKSKDEIKVKEILTELGYDGSELLRDHTGFLGSAMKWARTVVYDALWLTKEGDFLIWPKHKKEILERFSKLNKI